ncbi:MAG: hypothetical protein ABT940_12055 [Alphaproteobacteria bacterium]
MTSRFLTLGVSVLSLLVVAACATDGTSSPTAGGTGAAKVSKKPFPEPKPGEKELLLDAEDTARLVGGNSLVGIFPGGTAFVDHCAVGGVLEGTTNHPKFTADTGTWRVNEKGEMCRKWNRWYGGKEYCRSIYATGKGGYQEYDASRKIAITYRVRDGKVPLASSSKK